MDYSNEKMPEVSVICTTYNQEKYIANCLNGFLIQKTNFPFEVIVHDDCSTDGTLDIVLSYEKKYPDLFIVVTEEENQYSRNADFDEILMPYVRGRYIALCEGDDFWCDEQKLQRQYDFMESHPKCSLVCHNTIINDLGGKNPLILFNNWRDIHELTEDDVFIGWNVHTSSYFFRKEYYLVRNEFFQWCRYFGDYIRLCNAKDKGNVYCLPEPMSVYNFNNKDGVTKLYNSDIIKKLGQIEFRIQFLKKFDELTDHRHSAVILKRLKMQTEDLQVLQKKVMELYGIDRQP